MPFIMRSVSEDAQGDRILSPYEILQLLVQPSAVKANMKPGNYNQIASLTQSVPSFTHQGGPILNNPQFFNIFLGDWSSPDSQERIKRLNQFTQDLINSQYMSVLTQYGITDPGQFVNSVVIDNTDYELTDRETQVIVQAAIDATKIAKPARNNVYMIYLSDGTAVRDSKLNITMCSPINDNAFGYHSHFTTSAGDKFYYAVIPGLSDVCVANTCQASINCSVKLTNTREERQTQVASHEIAEMLTNPESTSWYSTDNGMENADICNGVQSTIKVGDRTWRVQDVYSKADAERGSAKCATSSSAAPLQMQAMLPGVNLDVRNKYNMVGSGLGFLFMAGLAVFQRKDALGFFIYSIIGIISGVAVTNMARMLPEEQKVPLRLKIDKIGNIITG